jgi:hypothetical protein
MVTLQLNLFVERHAPQKQKRNLKRRDKGSMSGDKVDGTKNGTIIITVMRFVLSTKNTDNYVTNYTVSHPKILRK